MRMLAALESQSRSRIFAIDLIIAFAFDSISKLKKFSCYYYPIVSVVFRKNEQKKVEEGERIAHKNVSFKKFYIGTKSANIPAQEHGVERGKQQQQNIKSINIKIEMVLVACLF